MPTTVIFGDAADGLVTASDAVYATAADGVGATIDAVGGSLSVGQRFLTGTYIVWEGFLAFDTTGLAGAIASALLSLFVVTDNSTTAEFSIQARLHDWGASLLAD